MCKGNGLSVMATLSNLSAFKMTSCDAKCNKCRPVPDKCLSKCFVFFSDLKNMTFRAIFAQDKMMGELKNFHAFTLSLKKLRKKCKIIVQTCARPDSLSTSFLFKTLEALIFLLN